MLIDAALMQQCAPQVHHAISYAIVKTESSFNPFAIGVNGDGRLNRQPTTYQQAVATAKQLLADGKSIDLGLAQINSKNLRWLGLSVEQAFHPCANLQAMQTVYLDCLKRFGNAGGQGTPMQRAWSCYNTGNATKGFTNGYVSKVTKHYNELAANYARRQSAPSQKPIRTNQASAQQRLAITPTPAPMPPQPTAPQIAADELEIPNVSSFADVTAAADEPINPPPKVHASWDVFGDF